MIANVKEDAITPTASSPFGRSFWLCYLANCALTIGFSILFRYADFITYLDGTEVELGLVIGVGMLGALAMRIVQAAGMDRWGANRVWLLSLLGFCLSCLAHLLITDLHSPWIYIARIGLATSVAGAFGASITFISLQVPANRVAEMIGLIGTGGFLGMATGPAIGDWLFAGDASDATHVRQMFLFAAGAGVIALLAAMGSTWNTRRYTLRRTPPIAALVKRYHPGFLLVVAAIGGLGICLPHEFLRAYGAELGLSQIQVFFLVYALTAFLVRIATRRIMEWWGSGKVVLCGTLALAVSMVLYLAVFNHASLAIPAVAAGTAHALLFPAIVGGGSIWFPVRFRGLGTTLMLTMFDFGNLLGKPAIGLTIALCRQWGLPAYPTMFCSMAVLTACVGLVYFRLEIRRERDRLAQPEIDAMPSVHAKSATARRQDSLSPPRQKA